VSWPSEANSQPPTPGSYFSTICPHGFVCFTIWCQQHQQHHTALVLWCFWGLPRLLHVFLEHYFLRLSNSPWYRQSTGQPLSSARTFGLSPFQSNYQQSCCECSCMGLCGEPFHLGKHTAMKRLAHMTNTHLLSWGVAKLFSKVTLPLCCPTSDGWNPCSSVFFLELGIIRFSCLVFPS
jgi:hypothetical protein